MASRRRCCSSTVAKSGACCARPSGSCGELAWQRTCTSSPAIWRSVRSVCWRSRALCADPSLLLLDEPAAGLRHQEKRALADVLRQLRGEGLSILLVEHDMDLVMGLTDRVVVMEFGTKLIEGTPEQVQASPAVRAAYLGTEH